jgi:O-antigen/teichoic acid export membrane protein
MSGRMVAFAATLLLPVVLARVLTQAEFGTYKQLFLLYATLYYIAQFGIAESLFYFLPSASAMAGRYLANAMACLTATGVVCLVFLDGAAGALAGWLNNPAIAEHTTLVGVFLLLMLISSVLEITMVTRGRYLLASATYGISDVSRALFLAAPAAFFRRVDAVLIGAIVFAAARLVVTLTYLIRTFRADIRPERLALARQLRYTVPFGLATMMEICQANLHLFAVSYYVDAATFAIYAVGCLQVPIVDLVATSAGNVMMVRMTDDRRGGAAINSLAIWHDTVRHLALVLVPLVALLLITARPLIVLLFTEQYAAAAPIFMIWSLAILPAVFMTDAALRVYARTRVLLLLNGVRLALIAALIPFAITAFGLIGAVLLTVGATALTKALGLAQVARAMRVTPGVLIPWGTIGATTGASAIAAMVAYGALSTIALPAFGALAVTSTVFGAVYLVCLSIFGVTTVSNLCVALRASSA